MLSSKFGVWVSVTLAGLAHAHIGPYHPAMYAINGTDPANPSMYTGISSNPLYNLKYNEYWMHAIHGVLNFPPHEEDAILITPGGTITLELAENAYFTTISPNHQLSPWGDGEQHPEGYSVDNLGGAPLSPEGCIKAPNLHCKNETTAAGTALAISYESDPSKVTPENTVVISVLEHTPFKRLATYLIPLGLPPSNGIVHLLWGWCPEHCGQANEYFFPLLARVLLGPTPAKTIGKPQPPVYCRADPSKCVKGPKQMVIVQQAEGNNVIGGDVLDPDGLWAAPGYNPGTGFENGAQNDIFVDANSPDALYPPPGQAAVLLASVSATSSDPASTAASGTPTPTDPASTAPGTPTPTDPASSLPATTPTESGTPTLPGSSGVPTASHSSCAAGHGGHKQRMMRREKHSVV